MTQRFLAVAVLVALISGTFVQAGEKPTVVRTIDMKAHNAPQPYDQNLKNNTGWHSHNKVGLVEGRFLGVKNNNRALIKEADGDVVEVPLFHYTARDLGYILYRMAKFPETIVDVKPTASPRPLIDLKTADLLMGPLKKWKNTGKLGGAFVSMNTPPVVEEIEGRKGVRFDYSRWYIDPQYNAMTADVLVPKSLAEGKPFTVSVWVCHPEDPDNDDPEAIMCWHGIEGNHGTTINWKLNGVWGTSYVAGLGGDLYFPDAKPVAQPKWTHLTYLYTGGIDGEFRVYENGLLKHTVKYERLPVMTPPTEITSTSVTLNGTLSTADGSQAYVVAYLGEFDAHYWMQHRHIGMWDKHNKVGFVNPGKFSAKFEGLKPGTRYYYRMLACGDTDYAHYDTTKRSWANGVGSFVTATADGKAGKIFPPDNDQHFFLGVHWGSRWYTAYPGPSAWFRGYIGDMRVYDRALDAMGVRKEAGLTKAYDAIPANGGDYGDTKASLSWKPGSKGVANYRVYLSAEKAEVETREVTPKDVTAATLTGVTLNPGRAYYWRVDQINAAGKRLAKSDVWTFRVTKGQPFDPFPKDGSTVNLLGDFRWEEDGKIKERRIYIGENKEEVLTSTKPLARVGRGRYDNIDALKPGRTYYWRIESVQEDDAVTPGEVWSFTTKNYFTAEPDVPVSEPYFDEIDPGRPGGRMMEGMGHPSLSTPGADEGDLWALTYGTNRFLHKSADLRRQCLAGPWGSTVGTFEGNAKVRGFKTGSYGAIPTWLLQLHEMGHQAHNLLNSITPDFQERLLEVFASHADSNAWLGDYAACNTGENMAVCTHQFTGSKGREHLRQEDAAMYHLLANYLPGDLAVELHPANGLAVDETDAVTRWANRGGLEETVGQRHTGVRFHKIEGTTGEFEAIGKPMLETVDGMTAVQFDGDDALLWNCETLYSFQDNRSWSVDLWVDVDQAATTPRTIFGWGPAEQGARLKVNASTIEYQLGPKIAGAVKNLSLGKGWHHVACVFQGGGLEDTKGDLTFYVDGQEVYRTKHKLALKPNVKMFVGGDVAAGQVTHGFQGALAHLRAYNYAIDHEQVENHYADEVPFYQRQPVPNIGGKLYVDIDTRFLRETGNEYHRPLYSKRMNKPWLRSAANHGTLQGRIHNDISDYWHYSGSAPRFKKIDGVDAPYFDGMDRMVGVIPTKGTTTAAGPVQGTLEAWVYSDAESKDEVVLEWGKDFQLTTEHLQPGWQHIALVFKGDVKKSTNNRGLSTPAITGVTEIYRNGKKVGEKKGLLWIDDGDYLHLGGHYDPLRWNWRKSFNGAIAALRLHQLPLTPEQLTENYQSDFLSVAHDPTPADRGMAVASRRSPLQWTPGLQRSGKQDVYLGQTPDAMKKLGSFATGECTPKLAAGQAYCWKVGNGPVWSFTTRKGRLLDMQSKSLPEGKLEGWKNSGQAGGTFTAATLGTTFAPITKTYQGKTGLKMNGALTSTFNAPPCLKNGPFTIFYEVASTYGFGTSPLLTWGANPKSIAGLYYGRSEHPALAWGKKPGRRHDLPRGGAFNYPYGNAGLGCIWKTFAITYANGTMKLYQDGRLISEKKVAYSVDELGPMVLGDGLIDRLVHKLQIYSKALTAKDVTALDGGKSVAKGSLQVALDFSSMKGGQPVLRVANTGKLKGSFSLPKEADHRAEVKTIADRKCVAFNGKALLESDITLPEGLTNDHPFTIEMWAYSHENQDARLFAMSKEATGARHASLGFGGGNQVALMKPGRTKLNWSTNQKVTGKWTHLAWVYDGGPRTEVRVYRDGKLDGKAIFATMDTIGGYPMYLGGMLNPVEGMRYLFKGGIAEMQAYDYARTAEEIAKDAKP